MVPIVCPIGRHCQFHDIAEGANPGKRVRNCESNRFEIGKVETARVMGGGAERIRESCHSRFESGSGHNEHDTLEKMYSSLWNPQLGGEAIFPERIQFIVQMVDDEVEDFWLEGGHIVVSC